jgi:ABC-type transporter Mla subunit MlaD
MMSQDTPRQGAAGEREELVAGIEQTRQDLAKTVQALAAKADVPSRMRDKASQVREQLSGTLTTLNSTAREKAPQVREQVAGTLTTLNTTAREKAPQVREQVTASLTKAGQSIPEPARRTAVQATDAAAKRPAALYAAAGVCTAVGLWLWRRKRS